MATQVITGRVAIQLAAVLHLTQGVAVLMEPRAAAITAVAAVARWLPSSSATATVFLIIGLLSLLGLVAERMATERQPYLLRSALWMIVPQEALLLLGAAGAIEAVLAGQYADGTAVSRWHLAGDQVVYILLAGFHTASLRDFFGRRRPPIP